MTELNVSVKEWKRCAKDKQRVAVEIESVQKAIMKAKANIEKAERKSSDVHKCMICPLI